MSAIPPDFGGLVGFWGRGDRAVIGTYAHGRFVDGMVLTPVNLLQARKTIDVLIAQGRERGYITDEHVRNADRYEPVSPPDVPPRSTVDEILGPE